MNNQAPLSHSEQLILSEQSISYLRVTQKWVKFLAILSFIGLGILFLAAIGLLISGLFIGNLTEVSFVLPILGFLYLILAGINFVPTWYLYKFSSNLEKMLNFRDNLKMEEAFRYLMAYYRFIGIMTIVILGIYLIVTIISAIAGIGIITHLIK